MKNKIKKTNTQTKRIYTFGGVFEGIKIKSEVKLEAISESEAMSIFETKYPNYKYLILTSPL